MKLDQSLPSGPQDVSTPVSEPGKVTLVLILPTACDSTKVRALLTERAAALTPAQKQGMMLRPVIAVLGVHEGTTLAGAMKNRILSETRELDVPVLYDWNGRLCAEELHVPRDQISVLLADRTGTELWRASGVFDAQSVDALLERLVAALA